MSTYIGNAPQGELCAEGGAHTSMHHRLDQIDIYSQLATTPTKRNKRKNFKPRTCSNVPDESNPNQIKRARTKEFEPESNSIDFSGDDEASLQNSDNEQDNSTSNNNLKLCPRRRKTGTTNRVLSNYYDDGSALNLSQKSDTESSDIEENGSKSHQFSIDNLSKSAAFAAAAAVRNVAAWHRGFDHSKMYEDMSSGSDLQLQHLPPQIRPSYNNPEFRDFAVSTMKELLGIYDAEAEAESISKQLPMGVFQSGKLSIFL